MSHNPNGVPPQVPGKPGGPIYVSPAQGTTEYGAPSAPAPQDTHSPAPEVNTPAPASAQPAPQAPPVPSHQPAAPAPQFAPAPAYTGPVQPRGLALTALLLGIGSLLFIWIPGLNFFSIPAGIVAVILGIVALKKRQPRGMAITGMILGSVVLLIMIFGIIGIIMYAVSNPGLYS